MKNRKLILLLVLPFMLMGCSATQPIAAKAMEEGLAQQDRVFNNTYNKLAQMILNQGSVMAENAVTDSNTNGAEEAVDLMFVEMKELAYLQVQWERGRALLRTPQEYIWSQRPFWQIMRDEWKAAEKEVDKSKGS